MVWIWMREKREGGRGEESSAGREAGEEAESGAGSGRGEDREREISKEGKDPPPYHRRRRLHRLSLRPRHSPPVSFFLYCGFRCNHTAPSSSDLKPPLYLLPALRATSSFSPSHKLGQGGFGPVFRSSLPDGHHVSVKLMDFGSLHGECKFQNELSLANKLLALRGSGYPSFSSLIVVPVEFCIDEPRRKWWLFWWDMVTGMRMTS